MLSEKVMTNLDNIYNKILGKKVFIFDLETIGLFDMKNYYKYWANDVFDNSRIIEIGYYYTTDFGKDIDNIIINSFLRKPTNFNFIKESELIHGISHDMLINTGYTFSSILNKDLLFKLNNCDFIIAHNSIFDFNILLNELHRFNLKNTISNLLNIKNHNNVLCTCRASGNKKLNMLYKNFFESDPEIQHRAGADVKTLIEILLKTQIKSIKINYELI